MSEVSPPTLEIAEGILQHPATLTPKMPHRPLVCWDGALELAYGFPQRALM